MDCGSQRPCRHQVSLGRESTLSVLFIPTDLLLQSAHLSTPDTLGGGKQSKSGG